MKKLFILVVLIAFYTMLAALFHIQNPLATPGTGRVTVTYDLIHSENLPCTVYIKVSSDAGFSYSIIPTAVTGDVGENVMPGIGKTIIWFPAVDGMEIGDNYKIKIIANDGQIPLPPANFVIVDGGSFHNGSSTIWLSSYYIDKYEVTQESYEEVMSWNPSWYFGNPLRPVERLSWFKAIEYCNRRSILEEIPPCYSYGTYGSNPDDWPLGWNTSNANHTNISYNPEALGYRLPTEMEWMFAAKGGNLSLNYTFGGSNTLSSVGWYYGNSDLSDGQGRRTHDVAQKTANELGLYDFSGNVWEYCWDIYGAYSVEDQENPTGATSGASRVLRGGSYNNDASACTVAYRALGSPTGTDRSIGFRLCRSIPEIKIVANPIIQPASGTYLAAQNVTITCATPFSTIRYTLDGSEPNQSSDIYSLPISINASATVKAKAFKSGWVDSETVSAEYVIHILDADFAFVAAGTFHNGYSNVSLSSYYIDKYEVSQASYLAVMGENPSAFQDSPNLPVERVNWFDAIEYCNRRSIGEGISPAYTYGTFGTNPDNWPAGWKTDNDNHYNVSCLWTATGYRLPTEMEWMFAAKGGNLSMNYNYSGSNDVATVAWYEVNSGARTHPVGSKTANELGIFDMSGNVNERCWDIYAADLPTEDQINPKGAETGIHCSIRGGSWDSASGACGVAYHWSSGGFVAKSDKGGFRICRSSM